ANRLPLAHRGMGADDPGHRPEGATGRAAANRSERPRAGHAGIGGQENWKKRAERMAQKTRGAADRCGRADEDAAGAGGAVAVAPREITTNGTKARRFFSSFSAVRGGEVSLFACSRVVVQALACFSGGSGTLARHAPRYSSVHYRPD